MRLFVYSPLSATARAYLLQQLPPDVEATFGADLNPGQTQAALQAAEVLLGNPAPALLAGPLPNLVASRMCTGERGRRLACTDDFIN